MVNFDDLEDIQKKAFEIAVSSDSRFVRIVGYAGTGKTTIMALVAKELGKRCVVLAPTNKAAFNLRLKGIDEAQTIHSFLYNPKQITVYEEDENGNPVYEVDENGEELKDENGNRLRRIKTTDLDFVKKEGGELEIPEFALVDEGSMVDEEKINDLMERCEKIIVFGDGFQLPPVGRGLVSSLELPGDPDIVLTDVHRVALESPIIQFVTDIRNGLIPDIKNYQNGKELNVCTINNKHIYNVMVEHEIQGICFRNSTRHMVNNRVRKALGHPDNTLKKGEPLICNQSVKEEKFDEYGNSERVLKLYNGQTFKSLSEFEGTENHFWAVMADIKDACGEFIQQDIYPFWNEDFFATLEGKNRLWDNTLNIMRGKGLHRYGAKFDYSYCLTAHKAQGSEYNNVAVFDERPSMRGDFKKLQHRWFYTACTRAKERLLVIEYV